MQKFSRLYQTLDQTTSTNAKVEAMAEYFATADPRDAAWSVYFLSGRRLKRLIGAAQLKEWLRQSCELPDWLIDDTYASVGDLAETVSLLLARPGQSASELPLADWLDMELLGLRALDADAQRQRVQQHWSNLNYEQCYIMTKLMTGALRVGVSQILLARAVARYADLPRALILHRLMGDWAPDAAFWNMLVSRDSGEAVPSRPYPFSLASPLETDVASLGPVENWQAEWKWDGIRAQLIRRHHETYLWSRGEELIGGRFPEITEAAQALPDGTVLDGEILAWNNETVMPFSQLQRRIGRKSVGKKLLGEVPCIFLAYDAMELDCADIRTTPLQQRTIRLGELVSSLNHPCIKQSTPLAAQSWQALAALRAGSRERLVEGLMLKETSSVYETGRKRGAWWKWKIEP
ncbi:MAG: ATP-dependent DNA ligase, partial [Granulosicoccus sp.]